MWTSLRLRLMALIWRSRFEHDLADELLGHLEERVDALMRTGLSPDEARRQARLEFGPLDTYKDQCRRVRGVQWLDDVRIDTRYAWRALRRSPGFALAVVATLAISIGFNATLFTIVSGMGGTPPVEGAERVVTIGSLDPGGRPIGASYRDFDDWRTTARSFAALAAYNIAPMILTAPDRAADRVSGAYISATTLSLIGERPILGRDFTAQDDQFGAPPVAVISAALWHSRFGSDAAILGRTITLNGTPTTIVGVMREGFRFPLVQDLWQPLASRPGLNDQRRDVRDLRVLGRLSPGVGLAQARAELLDLAKAAAQAYPTTNANITPHVQPFTGGFDFSNPWNAMLVAISLVLLIACANIANLLLARSASRARELAIRTSLGATRLRLVRQLLVESVLLAAMAGVVSVGLAAFGVRLWLASMPVADWPYWYHFALDVHVLGYIAALSLGSVVLFGVGPSWYLSGPHPIHELKDGRGATSNGPRTHAWTNVLLSAQFALTLALLAGAGLLARTLVAVYRADSIVDASPVLIAGVNPSPQRYVTSAQRIDFYRQLETAVGAIPSLEAATLASGAPFFNAPVRLFTLQGHASTQSSAAAKTSYVLIGDRYFETLGLRLHRGRSFTDLDGTPGHETAIVNQLFASTYLPGTDPLGQRLRLTDPNRPDQAAPWLTIVGVSPSVREHYAQEFDPVVYVPYRLNPPSDLVLLTRSRSEAASLTPALRDTLRQLDPDLPLVNVRPLTWLLSGTRFANQVFATLFSIAAGLGLALAAIGLYALITFDVRQRTQEIGIRMALGAPSSQVIWMFVRRLWLPLAAGLVVGLAAAIGVGQFVRGMLIGTSPTDPMTFAAMALVLLAVALIATLAPTRRATRLDPVSALRCE